MILSNELLDQLSVYKVILSASGSAETAFVVPSLSTTAWNRLKTWVPVPAAKLVAKADENLTDEHPPVA